MRNPEEYRRGYNDAIRAAITWLHQRADQMNDPNAKAVLNSAAFHLGVNKPDAAIAALRPAQDAEGWRKALVDIVVLCKDPDEETIADIAFRAADALAASPPRTLEGK